LQQRGDGGYGRVGGDFEREVSVGQYAGGAGGSVFGRSQEVLEIHRLVVEDFIIERSFERYF